MAYLGNAPARSFISFEKQVFTIVNSQTAYTLSNSVTNENDIRLVINNVVQEPGAGKAYTASGTTLTLSAALTNGTDEMYCVFLGKAVGTVNPPAASVAASQLAADSVTAAKLNDDIISGQTELATAPASTDELLISDAGTLKRIDVSLIGGTNTPSFFAHRNGSGDQSISENTQTKVQMDQEVYDVGGCYNATGSTVTLNGISVPSYAFAPNEAGKYFVYASVRANENTSDTNQVEANIRVNGSNIVGGATVDNRNNPGADTTTTINHVVVLDGVDDYVEIFCKVENASDSASAFHQEGTYFGAYKIIE